MDGRCLFRHAEHNQLSRRGRIIENYPGFPDGISGDELLGLFTSHAEKNGVSIHEEGIVKVLTDERKAVDMFGNEHEYDEYVEAVGLKRKEYTCPGIENVPVHTCAVCDGSLYGEKARGKKTHVVVIGGGDTAVSNALYLSGIAGRVTMLVRKPVCRATNVKALKELEQKPNVEIMYETVLESVTKDGNGHVACHLGRKGSYADGMVMDVDGLFVCIGYSTNAVEHVGDGRVWLCGDCAEQHKQVAVAVGSGAKTALDIIEASR